jgi:membrane-associated phospholipid phosphatase
MLTCLTACVIAGLLPAVGAYVHHAPAQAIRDMIAADAGVWHLQHYEALRAGAFRVFELRHTEGIITFPSFHTACALLVPLALRGMGVVTALAWAFAATVMVSTVPIGGHYLIDVIAGAAMTVAVMHGLGKVRWPLAPAPEAAVPRPA